VPVYEYRCDHCGPFDLWRPPEEASAPVACLQCSGPARRAYSPLANLTRVGVLATGSSGDPTRIDRARTGEPSVTESLTGRRFRPPGSHAH
jgi:putative FmdB family regulatory protein